MIEELKAYIQDRLVYYKRQETLLNGEHAAYVLGKINAYDDILEQIDNLEFLERTAKPPILVQLVDSQTDSA